MNFLNLLSLFLFVWPAISQMKHRLQVNQLAHIGREIRFTDGCVIPVGTTVRITSNNNFETDAVNVEAALSSKGICRKYFGVFADEIIVVDNLFTYGFHLGQHVYTVKDLETPSPLS